MFCRGPATIRAASRAATWMGIYIVTCQFLYFSQYHTHVQADRNQSCDITNTVSLSHCISPSLYLSTSLHHLLCQPIIPVKDIHIPPTTQAHQYYGVDNYATVRKDPRDLNERTRDAPQDTDSAGVEHQRQWEFHRIPKPPLRQSTQQMPMRHKQHVTGVLPVHVIFVQRPNLFDQTINAGRNLFRRPISNVVNVSPRKAIYQTSQKRPDKTGPNSLSILTAVSPNIPRSLHIQTMLLPQRPNLLGQKPLIQPIIPLRQPLSLRNLVRISQGQLVRLIKGNLKGFQRSPARTDIHMRDLSRVNQSARANDHLARGEDLLLAIGGEFKLAGPGVSAAFGPFRLSWMWVRSIYRVVAREAGGAVRTVSVEEDTGGAGVFVWHCCNGAIQEGFMCR